MVAPRLLRKSKATEPSSILPASIREKSENVVDDGEERIRRALEHMHIFGLFSGQRSFEQEFRHADDGAPRARKAERRSSV